MIFTMELLKNKKEFNLFDAIVNDEVDIIFGESEELLEEIAHISGKNNMQIIIRNLYEDQTDSHWFSMKFIPSRNIKGDTYAGRKGIPIVFNLISDNNGGQLSNWKVYLGGSKHQIARAEQLQDELNRREKAFINSVVEELGIIILEYWNLNPNNPVEYKRLEEIRQFVESKYIK